MVINLSKTVILLILAYIILPTGPSDIIIIPFLVGILGQTGYILLSIGLGIYVYKTIKGRGIFAKMRNVQKELKGLIS